MVEKAEQITYTETFYSLQGEGMYMGTPSVFLRTFGCNFRCKNFSADPTIFHKGPNPEVQQIINDIDQYETYEDLPLVSTGCDSYSSTYAPFTKFAKTATASGIAKILTGLTPNYQWGPNCHLVITGGEPLLGWQKFYAKILSEKCMSSLTNLTFETNGTQYIDTAFFEFLTYQWRNFSHLREINFSVSPKLTCSGEKRNKTLLPDVIRQYQYVGNVCLKFVVGTQADVDEALEYMDAYEKVGFTGPVYLMPVGGIDSQFIKSNKEIANLALKHGLRYSDRMHLALFGNAWNT